MTIESTESKLEYESDKLNYNLEDTTKPIIDPLLDKTKRRCIASGNILPKEKLIRFALNPDNVLTFDVNQKLPGRGAWLMPNKASWQKTVKAQLWKRAFKVSKVTIPDDMESIIDSQLTQKALQLISKLRVCRQCVGVFSQIEKKYKKKQFANRNNASSDKTSLQNGFSFYQSNSWLLIACDAGADVLKRLVSLSNNSYVKVPCLTSSEIGKIFNRERTPSVFISSGVLSRRLRSILASLELWRGQDLDKNRDKAKDLDKDKEDTN